MTDEQWEELRPFAIAAARADEIVQNWMMTSVPTGVRERLEANIAIERARIEASRASLAFEAAKIRILGEPTA